eukprot:3092086-Prorocentrum_lima.AAC.1
METHVATDHNQQTLPLHIAVIRPVPASLAHTNHAFGPVLYIPFCAYVSGVIAASTVRRVLSSM